MIPRSLRLMRSRIEHLFKKGKRIGNDCFAIRYLPARARNTDGRYCVIVSTGVEPLAVKRNRLRRRIYEIIRLNTDSFPEGLDLALIGKKTLAGLDYGKIQKSLLSLIRKLRQ